MKLDVYVNHDLIGTLEQVEVNRYVFSYQAGVASSQMVSLLMPVRTESWIHCAQRMLELWSHGCTIHSADAARHLKVLATSLGRAAPFLQ